MSDHASVCPLDCPDTCSLTVTVEHAKIVKIRGSRANPYTAGVICTKVAGSYPEWVHGPGRLQTPLRRIGAKGEGRFAPVSWDEALDIIHERVTSVIAAHGPQIVGVSAELSFVMALPGGAESSSSPRTRPCSTATARCSCCCWSRRQDWSNLPPRQMK